MKQRKFIHVDMDCFYAAVEMRDNPSLRDIPIAVGGSPDKRGVVATCNYLARAFGVHSAMATAYAIRLCPALRVIPGRMSYYQTISQQFREILGRYTDIIEPLSLDEAFLDVTDATLFHGSATLIATDIRATIEKELGLTASAGVAPNKFLAKICSDENKPNGQCVISPADIGSFVEHLSLKKIPGVGKVTMKRLEQHGLCTCADVREMGLESLTRLLGRFGEHLYKRSHGIDDRNLTTAWIRKRLSVERTYAADIFKPVIAIDSLNALFEELVLRLKKHQNRLIKNQQVKLKFANFKQTTIERASLVLDKSLYEELLPIAWDRGGGMGIRLLGIGVTFHNEHPVGESRQLELF